MMEKLRRDSYVVGGALGILIPAVLFGILFGIFAIVLHFNPQMLVNKPNLIKVLTPDFILLAMIPNVLLLRYYLLKLKFDKTGRGIIAVSLLCAVAFLATQFLM